MRLLCLRSGARIRRADCLRSARRHLQTYQPSVVIVDMGLPDGSGAELIGDLARAQPRVPAILGISGEPSAGHDALAAGADGFLAAFQRAVLDSLPNGHAESVTRGEADEIAPDPIALRDDLAHAADLLSEAGDEKTLDYVARFLAGIGRSSHDGALADAALAIQRLHRQGLPHLQGIVRDRLAAGAVF
jgi:CheY-like chemotaxis protein